MSVVVDGRERHRWHVSTGLNVNTPAGSYAPQRMEKMWYSRKYDMAPMPHAIFFYHGFAIHGTNQVSRLGQPASHGCVRLHPSHAAALYALVKSHGMANTRIAITGGGAFFAQR